MYIGRVSLVPSLLLQHSTLATHTSSNDSCGGGLNEATKHLQTYSHSINVCTWQFDNHLLAFS